MIPGLCRPRLDETPPGDFLRLQFGRLCERRPTTDLPGDGFVRRELAREFHATPCQETERRRPDTFACNVRQNRAVSPGHAECRRAVDGLRSGWIDMRKEHKLRGEWIQRESV